MSRKWLSEEADRQFIAETELFYGLLVPRENGKIKIGKGVWRSCLKIGTV
jgi:hypothetical protein